MVFGCFLTVWIVLRELSTGDTLNRINPKLHSRDKEAQRNVALRLGEGEISKFDLPLVSYGIIGCECQ